MAIQRIVYLSFCRSPSKINRPTVNVSSFLFLLFIHERRNKIDMMAYGGFLLFYFQLCEPNIKAIIIMS